MKGVLADRPRRTAKGGFWVAGMVGRGSSKTIIGGGRRVSRMRFTEGGGRMSFAQSGSFFLDNRLRRATEGLKRESRAENDRTSGRFVPMRPRGKSIRGR